MKKIKYLLLTFVILGFQTATAQPELSSWILNTNGATGYNGIPSNIQKLQYSTDYIYVSASCIPGYDIGPWKANPNTASNQNFVFKITRKPTKNNGNATKIGLGHVGIWSNGVSIYNASDGMSYNNAGVWNRNAYFFEGISFDNCLGHPAQNGEYHHHVSPKCLYNSADSSKHSPIIGYAWDGYPIYGAYAYTNTDGTGKIKRMSSSYKLKSLVTRANGPNIDQTYPLGCFMEDYEYVSGIGDLDERNGRFCVTPDYPNGTYAYFVTIDKDQTPVYPYVMFNSYYGVVTAGNTGPGSGHVTITESVTTYNPSSGVNVPHENQEKVTISPNPSSGNMNITIQNSQSNNYHLKVRNSIGQVVYEQVNLQPTIGYSISLKNKIAGIYFVEIYLANKKVKIEKVVIQP
jgi:hypothetical protein